MRVRAAGAIIGRGFFNDFDADGMRDVQPQETIQFLVADGPVGAREGLGAARYVAQSRPTTGRASRRSRASSSGASGAAADIIVVNGAERALRYTSAEMYDYAYKHALPRTSGRAARNAIILPINKTPGVVGEDGARAAHVTSIPITTRPPGTRSRDTPGGRSRHLHHLPAAVPQPGRLPAGARVRLHHLLRVRGRAPAGLRSDLPRAPGRTPESRMALRPRGARVARPPGPSLVGAMRTLPARLGLDRPAAQWALVAASLVVVVLGVRTMIVARRLQREVEELQSRQPRASGRRGGSTRQQIARARESRDTGAKPVEREQSTSFTLSIGLPAGGGPPTRLVVADDTEIVRLQLNLPAGSDLRAIQSGTARCARRRVLEPGTPPAGERWSAGRCCGSCCPGSLWRLATTNSPRRGQPHPPAPRRRLLLLRNRPSRSLTKRSGCSARPTYPPQSVGAGRKVGPF